VNSLSGLVAGSNGNTYFSPTNDLYDTNQKLLNSATFSAIGTQGPFTASGSTSGLFSVTERYVIIDTAGSTGNNIAIDLSATPGVTSTVPEPGSMLLVGSGLTLAGLLYYRRRIKRPSMLISIA